MSSSALVACEVFVANTGVVNDRVSPTDVPTALVAVHSYINPIVAIILGNILMQEKLTAFIVAGTMITLWGVYLVNNSFKKAKA